MNTTDLGELLHGATAGVEPPTGFAEQVLRGGRRRRFRRRLTMMASAAVVAAVAVTGTVVAGQDDAAPSVADQRLTTTTRGDLADDQAFLDQVTKVWQSELTYADEARFRLYDDLRGKPHVYWAGNTPVGRAAIVMQETYVHQDYWVHDGGTRVAEGLVAIDPEDGKLKLVGTRSPMQERGPVSSYLLGDHNHLTMLIVDEGKPLYYSTRPTGAEQSPNTLDSYRPEWHRTEAPDGVALVPVTVDPGPGQVQRILAYHGDDPPEVVDMNTRSITGAPTTDGYLDHRQRDPNYRLPIPNFFQWQDKWTLGTPASGVNADELQFNARPRGAWQITAWLPDRVVFVQETLVIRHDSQRDSKGSVLTVGTGKIVMNALEDTTSVDLASVDHDAVLPIRYRIPDGGGWIVAQKGQSLAYRTAPGGQWQDAGKDAALLPDNAVEVQVGDQVVTL